MMSKHIEINDEAFDEAIGKGINYLYEHQLPNGEYMSYYSPDDQMLEWCVPDSIVFFTSVICNSLLKLRDHPGVTDILSLSKKFLMYQMMSGGVWNYFTKWNQLFAYSPADIDDTVFASFVLHSLETDIPDNTAILLSNRNACGLFYTWFVLRRENVFRIKELKTMARELKRPLKSILFWKKHAGGRNDIDAAVNANVLFHLGPGEHAEVIKDYLSSIIINNKELDADKWYRNPIILYYLISRNHPVVNFSVEVQRLVVQKTFDYYHSNGSFGKSELETAFAAMTLMNFSYKDERLTKAISYLLQSQQKPGYWNRTIFFYSGPDKAVGWGSEELSTAICIEALHQYKNFRIA